VSVAGRRQVFVGSDVVNVLLLEERLRGLTSGVRQRRVPAGRRGAALRRGHPRGGCDQARGNRPHRLRVCASGGEAAVNEAIDRLIVERQRLDRGLPATVLFLDRRPPRGGRPRRGPPEALPRRAAAARRRRLRRSAAERRRGLAPGASRGRARAPAGPRGIGAARRRRPPQVRKPPKAAPKPDALPLPDSRRSAQAPGASDASLAGRSRLRHRQGRSPAGRSARRPRSRSGDTGPRARRPGRARRARRHRQRRRLVPGRRPAEDLAPLEPADQVRLHQPVGVTFTILPTAT